MVSGREPRATVVPSGLEVIVGDGTAPGMTEAG
jgi:hypothetical protein